MSLPAADLPVFASRIPALEYHDPEYNGGAYVQMTTAWFLEQMLWLFENGYKTLTCAELLQYVQGQASLPQKSCFLRFDIGLPNYKSFQEVVVPTLNQYGFRATFFILTCNIKEIAPPKGNFISWSHLRAWEQTGLIEMASHGVNHYDYRKTGTATRLWDLSTSKRTLETKLGHAISAFTWPFDSVPSHPDVLLKLFGYTLGFAGHRVERSILPRDRDQYALPAYYPYSGKKIYPLLYTANRLTFPQMMQAAIAPK